MKFYTIYRFFLFLIVNKAITSWRNNLQRKTQLLMNDNREKQCVVSKKDNTIYCNSEVKLYIDKNDFLANKKLITVSPGGFKGFYLLGILTYIKETYNLDNFIFSGASAGAWNSLFMCYKGDPLDFVYNLVDYNIKKTKSITELEYFIKYKLLTSYKDKDFDLNRLFIGVTNVKWLKATTNIFSDFENLEDAINCCIASSHIPLLTGGLTNRYHNSYAFDGGFSSYPYLNNDNLVLHVSPSMWEEMTNTKPKGVKGSIRTLKDFSEIFSVSKNNLMELFDHGYQDARKHKECLAKIFEPRIDNDSRDDILEF